MNIFQKYLCAWFFVFSVAIPLVELGAQAPSESFLLLTNGSVVRGQIQKISTGYEVQTSRGSKFLIPTKQAAQLLGSLEQVFAVKFANAKKRNRIEPLRQLVFWAVNEKLFDSARRVVDHMAADRAKKTMAEQLREYVKTSQQRHLQPAVESIAWQSKTVNDPLKPRRLTSNPLNARKNSTAQQPTIKELDKLTKSLPPGSLKVFRKLQVKVAKNCYTAGCHSKPSDGFQVFRMPPGERIPFRLTQKNVYQIFRFTDEKDPDKSRILHYMSTPHGKQAAAGFPKGSPHFVLMRNWLFHVTKNGNLWRQKEIQRITEAAKQRTTQPPAKVDPNVKPASFTPPDPDDLLRGQKKKMTSDPFDPDIFNQKYHGITREQKSRTDAKRPNRRPSGRR